MKTSTSAALPCRCPGRSTRIPVNHGRAYVLGTYARSPVGGLPCDRVHQSSCHCPTSIPEVCPRHI